MPADNQSESDEREASVRSPVATRASPTRNRTRGRDGAERRGAGRPRERGRRDGDGGDE